MLEAIPDAEIAVYAVWFNMLRSDTETRWPGKILTDPRVKHYWDANQAIGMFFGENVTAHSPGHVEWDAYFLYDRSARWAKDGPSGLVSWGRTIVSSRKQLEADLREMLGSAESRE